MADNKPTTAARRPGIKVPGRKPVKLRTAAELEAENAKVRKPKSRRRR
jgi:hypothetical protein